MKCIHCGKPRNRISYTLPAGMVCSLECLDAKTEGLQFQDRCDACGDEHQNGLCQAVETSIVTFGEEAIREAVRAPIVCVKRDTCQNGHTTFPCCGGNDDDPPVHCTDCPDGHYPDESDFLAESRFPGDSDFLAESATPPPSAGVAPPPSAGVASTCARLCPVCHTPTVLESTYTGPNLCSACGGFFDVEARASVE